MHYIELLNFGVPSMVAVFLLGAFSSLIFRKNDGMANILSNVCAVIAASFGLYISISTLLGGQEFSFSLASFIPNFDIRFQIDLLSSIFLFAISLITVITSIYGFGYLKHYYGKYNIGTLGFFYNLFVLGMALVVTATNAIMFLIAWELMSLTSYFLVIYEYKKKKNVQAGSHYIIITHIGTAFIMLAFLLLFKETGTLNFEAIKENLDQIPLYIKNFVFIFAFIGFGIKAGIIPMHYWLPKAHPAAPSHVSALMSGVMIKTGIYMIIRLSFDIFPQPEYWWGVLILILGAISAILGVLYALSEHDLKKLLAYHSIENIGIILLGIGSSLIFIATGLNQLAVLGLVAALYHTINHAIFKSLLFLSAGSVISATGTRNIEKYGGLIKLMPYTTIFFLIGSMAIAALPPLNGFFSEWLTYQSLFLGIRSFGTYTQLLFIFGVALFAITGGLAAACFVKVFGTTFMAKPRSDQAQKAKETSPFLKMAMFLVALFTILFGLFSGFITSIITRAIHSLRMGFGETDSVISTFQNIKIDGNFAIVSMPILFVLLLAVIFVVFFLVTYYSRKNKIKIGCAWDCGTELTPRMEITATGFSRSIITIFKQILRPTHHVDESYHDTNFKYFVKETTLRLGIHNIYESYIDKPLHKILSVIANHVKKIQSGNENAYILYIFITLITLIILNIFI